MSKHRGPMQSAEALVQRCREQLRRSLAVQMEGRKSLEAMRADFERLTQQLAAATQGSSQATQEEALDSAGQSITRLLHTAHAHALQVYSAAGARSGMAFEKHITEMQEHHQALFCLKLGRWGHSQRFSIIYGDCLAVSGMSSEEHVALPAAQPSQRDRIAVVLEK